MPDRIRLFRFPFGSCHAEGLATAAHAGLLSIQWDVSTGDPSPLQSARAIADTMIRQVKPGSIILAHGNGRGHHTAAALPLALPKLRAMGYEFVTVSELLAAGEPVITPTCYDSRPGDTDKYDTLFAPRVAPNVNVIKPSLSALSAMTSVRLGTGEPCSWPRCPWTTAERLGPAIAAIGPWAHYNFTAANPRRISAR